MKNMKKTRTKTKKTPKKTSYNNPIKPIYDVRIIEDKPIFKYIELITAFASLIISLASLSISCKMQSEINTFTENMSNVNYELSIKQTPSTISQKDLFNNQGENNTASGDEVYYTISPFVITKDKDDFSGDFGKCYFATVYNESIDLCEFNDKFIGRYFNNGCIIGVFDKSNDDEFSFFYSPGSHTNWSIIHIIIQGYNGDKDYYTLVCSCKNNRQVVDSELFNNENIYDKSKVEKFINRTTLDISTDELIEKVETERALLKEKLS